MNQLNIHSSQSKHTFIGRGLDTSLAEGTFLFNKMERLPVIYKIVCNGNNKIYVGSAKDYGKRKITHLCSLRKNESRCIKLQRAFNLYGEDSFCFEIIEYVKDISKLSEREMFWIKELNAIEGGMNIAIDTNAPMLGRKHSEKTKQLIRNASSKHRHSEETKKKISEIHKGKKRLPLSIETRTKIANSQMGSNNSFYGKKHSDEFIKIQSDRYKGRQSPNKGNKFSMSVREKMSISQKQRHINNLNVFRKPIQQLDLNGLLLKEWNSGKEAAEKLECSASSISACCRGVKKTHKKFIWKFKQINEPNQQIELL